MKKLILTIPLLALLTAAYAGGDNSEKQAMNMLRKFYKSYIAEVSKSNPSETAVQALIEKNTTGGFREMMQENEPDCDVFLWKQDYDKSWAKSLKVEVSDDYSWMYKVSFEQSRDDRIPMWIDVEEEDGRWLISNIDNLHLGSSDYDDYDSSSQREVGYTDTDEFEFLEYNDEGDDPRIFVLVPYYYSTATDLINRLNYEPDLNRGDKISITWEIESVGEVEEGEEPDEEDVVIAVKEIEGVTYGPLTKFLRSPHATVEYSLRGDWTEAQKKRFSGAVGYYLASTDDEQITKYLEDTANRLDIVIRDRDETIAPGEQDGQGYEEDGAWIAVTVLYNKKGAGPILIARLGIEFGKFGEATYYKFDAQEGCYEQVYF